MKRKCRFALAMVALLILVGCGGSPTAPPTPPPSDTPRPTVLPTSTARPTPVAPTPQDTPTPAVPTAEPTMPTPLPGDPFEMISLDSLFRTLEDLTAIQPYSGWRNSGTEGEQEALDYIEGRLGEMAFLSELGLELERQTFNVFMSTEQWETRLLLTVDGQEIEVPAAGLRGPRDEIGQALRFDSDGVLNDTGRDPVVAQGPTLLVRSAGEIGGLNAADVQGRVVLLDHAVIDRTWKGWETAYRAASDLLEEGPAGLVVVTEFSNQPYESHGAFVADTSILDWIGTRPVAPMLYVRLEDLGPAGIDSWDDLARVEAAHLTWDADVFAPGTSGNLVARIPGADASRAMILGAHIDSPNNPGAMDDGSGSAVLLEVARVLDAARFQPPVDLYLVWFGSEEIGLYGSYHFVSTHQELLDRTMAMLQVDCLTRPLDGIDGYLNLVTWSYGRLGDGRLTWPDFLVGAVDPLGVWIHPTNYYGIESDNTAFTGFDVPSANLIYMDQPAMEGLCGSIHCAGHIHDPYDTVELARDVASAFEDMARVALTAALRTAMENPILRVAPRPDRRVLFVASHTESVHMSPTTLTDMGMALAWEGFDVDLIPYGQPVTPADLAGADLVVVLPVVDYPSPEGDTGVYDEVWSEGEIAALEAYAAEGGLLVLSNSNHRLKYGNRVLDANEDVIKANALAGRFGVSFLEGTLFDDRAWTEGEHPLIEGIESVEMIWENGVPFDLAGGQVLAWAGGEPAIALVEHDGGEVLVLADLGMLSAAGPPTNLRFWQNIARYARER